MFQKLLLVLAQIVSKIVDVVINLLLEILVVSLAEVNNGVLKHSKASENENSGKVGFYPDWVVYGWQNIVDTILKLNGDQDCSHCDEASCSNWLLIYPETTVGDDDEDDWGNNIVDHKEVWIPIYIQDINEGSIIIAI